MNKIESKKIRYQVEREIEYIKVSPTLAVFKETKIIGGKLHRSNEGIADLETLQNIELDEEIKINREYDFMKKTVEQVHRCVPTGLFSGNYFSKYEELKVDNPYTFIKENDNYKDGYGFYRFDSLTERLYDIDNNELPKAVIFSDSSSQRVLSTHFNIKEMLNYLKTRDDICLLDDGLLDTPYFITEKYGVKHLRFVWMPKEEDYKELLKDRKNPLKIKEILNLIQFANKEQ